MLLLMSIHQSGVMDKKASLDRAIDAIDRGDIGARELARTIQEHVKTTNLIRKMFPNIKQTRFRNTAEFSLFLLVWEMQKEGFILTNAKRNRQAFGMLRP